MSYADRLRERARIVTLLRAEATRHDADAEAVLARCPGAFGCSTDHLEQLEREQAAHTYRLCAALAYELRRVAYLIEKEKP